jgi:ABC-type Fe3+-citrate transport system substrate-binding protein
MIKKVLPVFLVALLLLFAGCTQKEGETTTSKTQETLGTGDTTVEPSEIPVLEENDSVEIGEMI